MVATPGQTAVAGALAGSQPVLQPGGSWSIHAPGAVSSNGHPLMVNSPQAIANNPVANAAGIAAAQPAAPQPPLRGAYSMPGYSPNQRPRGDTYSGTEGHYMLNPAPTFAASGYQKGQPVDGMWRFGAQRAMPANFHPPAVAKPQNFGFMGMKGGQPVEYDSNAHMRRMNPGGMQKGQPVNGYMTPQQEDYQSRRYRVGQGVNF